MEKLSTINKHKLRLTTVTSWPPTGIVRVFSRLTFPSIIGVANELSYPIVITHPVLPENQTQDVTFKITCGILSSNYD